MARRLHFRRTGAAPIWSSRLHRSWAMRRSLTNTALTRRGVLALGATAALAATEIRAAEPATIRVAYPAPPPPGRPRARPTRRPRGPRDSRGRARHHPGGLPRPGGHARPGEVPGRRARIQLRALRVQPAHRAGHQAASHARPGHQLGV